MSDQGDGDNPTPPVMVPPAEVQATVGPAPKAVSGEIVEQHCSPAPVLHQESDAVKIAQIKAASSETKFKWTIGALLGGLFLFLSKDWWSKRDLDYSHKGKDGSSRKLSLKLPQKGNNTPSEPKS